MDRRTSPRTDLDMHDMAELVLEAMPDQPVRCVIRNISKGGVLLELPETGHPLPLSEERQEIPATVQAVTPQTPVLTTPTPVDVVWIEESYCGVKFREELETLPDDIL